LTMTRVRCVMGWPRRVPMQCVTTNSIDGKVVLSYRGIVSSEVVFGANVFRDLAASLADFGGRQERFLRERV
jgi:uncharacterized protein YbjQ (UPF0145 family)